jgi:hypothetical protein
MPPIHTRAHTHTHTTHTHTHNFTGHSGRDTLKGCVNLRAPGSLFREEQQYVLSNVEAIFANGAASLPSQPGLPDFGKCLACLYYAKAKADDSFMSTDPECMPCRAAYCV